MNNDIYYSTKTIPLVERETFNNTIILLTLVKSNYYYIVGFSRPNNIIEIAFDFESELHTRISESITVDFSLDKEYVLMHSVLKNVTADMMESVMMPSFKGEFSIENGCVVYNYKVKKDKLIPTSIEQMNKYILLAKKEIICFLERLYEERLS